MTLRLSSGLRDAIATNYGLGRLLNKGYIEVYSGEQPEFADLPPSGELLARITQDGLPPPDDANDAGGLQLQLGASPGDLVNKGAWVMKGVATGSPGWWRFRTKNDAGDSTQSSYRMDGASGDSMAPTAPITPATATDVVEFRINLPYQ